MSSIAFFVSPHGFGHAARASAVMGVLRRLRPEVELHVFTTVPRWFFDDTLRGPLSYYPARTDVGLVQTHPLHEDLPATIEALEEFWARMPEAANEAAAILERHRVEIVVCDISPLGIAAAASAGRPSVLVENFTWDWIYRGGYTDEDPRLERFARRNADLFARADLWVQARPFCRERPGAVSVAPVSRPPRAGVEEIRRLVGLEPEERRPMVLMTMGGMGWREDAAASDSGASGAFFVTLGGVDGLRREENRLALPDRSPIYPPDLVAAADLVVAKLGYSTVAECYRSGARLLFLDRPRFPESAVLARFAGGELEGIRLDPSRLEDGSWTTDLDAILERPRPERGSGDGADEIAGQLLSRLG